MAIRLPGPTSTAWVLAETAGSAVFSLLSLLVIGRVIGPHEAGIGTVAIAAFLMLDVVGAALFTDSLIQLRGLSERHARSAISAAALVGGLGGLLMAGGGPLLYGGAGEGAVAWMMLVLAPLLPLSAMSGAAAGLAIRGERFRLLALRVLVGQPLALGAGLTAAAMGLGAWAMVIAQAVATVFVFLLFVAARRMPLRPLLDRSALGALWPVAGPQIGAIVLMVGKYRLFILALGLLLAEAALAQSHVAFRMLDAALVVAWSALTRIAMPRLCAVQTDREALARRYAEIAQLPPLICLPIALGVALVADDLVVGLLGPAWGGAAEAARVIALAACVTVFQGDPFSLFVAIGRARWNMVVGALGVAVPLLALLVLQPKTPAGAALAWASQCLVVTPVVMVLVLRALGKSPLWLLRPAVPGVIAAAAMVPAVLATQAALAEAPALLRLLAAAGVGAAAFGATAWVVLGRRLPRALASSTGIGGRMAAPRGVPGEGRAAAG